MCATVAYRDFSVSARLSVTIVAIGGDRRLPVLIVDVEDAKH